MTNANPSESLASGETNVPPVDGTENALDVKGNSALLHTILNEELGTSYKSPEDAVAGLKETKNYVGKAGKYIKAVEAVMTAKGVSEDDAVKYIMETVQTTTPATQSEQVVQPAKVEQQGEFVSKAEFDKAMFYKDNPDLVPFSNILNSLAVGGKTLADAAKDETFTSLVTAKKAQDESEQSKSALISSGRLGEVSDKLTQARESLDKGDWNSARVSAVSAVLEATEPKK